MDRQEVGWRDTDWIDLAGGLLKCGNKRSGFIKRWEFLD